MVEERKKHDIIDILRIIAMLLAIWVLIWLLTNQIQEYLYEAELLMYPCDLCIELNPHLEECLTTTIIPDFSAEGTDYINLTLSP